MNTSKSPKFCEVPECYNLKDIDKRNRVCIPHKGHWDEFRQKLNTIRREWPKRKRLSEHGERMIEVCNIYQTEIWYLLQQQCRHTGWPNVGYRNTDGKRKFKEMIDSVIDYVVEKDQADEPLKLMCPWPGCNTVLSESADTPLETGYCDHHIHHIRQMRGLFFLLSRWMGGMIDRYPTHIQLWMRKDDPRDRESKERFGRFLINLKSNWMDMINHIKTNAADLNDPSFEDIYQAFVTTVLRPLRDIINLDMEDVPHLFLDSLLQIDHVEDRGDMVLNYLQKRFDEVYDSLSTTATDEGSRSKMSVAVTGGKTWAVTVLLMTDRWRTKLGRNIRPLSRWFIVDPQSIVGSFVEHAKNAYYYESGENRWAFADFDCFADHLKGAEYSDGEYLKQFVKQYLDNHGYSLLSDRVPEPEMIGKPDDVPVTKQQAAQKPKEAEISVAPESEGGEHVPPFEILESGDQTKIKQLKPKGAVHSFKDFWRAMNKAAEVEFGKRVKLVFQDVEEE